MIQRIQSVFLLLAATALFLTFYFPIALFEAPELNARFTNYGWINTKNIVLKSYPLYIGVATIATFIFASILMYKNRKRQILIGRINYLLILGLFALYFFLPDQSTNALLKNGVVSQGTGFFMPLVAMAFIYLAENLIKKDEKLVRSADRLR